MDIFIHVANILYLFSYLVRDILWLRMLTVVAISCLMPFFYYRPEPLMAPIYWNLAFTAINLYRIYFLLLERKPVQLKEEEQQLYRMVFRTLKPREMLKLLKFANWKTATPGERLVEQNTDLDNLMVVYSGNASVSVEGKEVAKLRGGQFIGEMSFLTGSKTSASVEAKDALRYVRWPKEQLTRFLERNPDLRAALQMIMGVDLVAKVRG